MGYSWVAVPLPRVTGNGSARSAAAATSNRRSRSGWTVLRNVPIPPFNAAHATSHAQHARRAVADRNDAITAVRATRARLRPSAGAGSAQRGRGFGPARARIRPSAGAGSANLVATRRRRRKDAGEQHLVEVDALP